MIEDLDERAEFWGTRDKGGYEGSSDPAYAKHRGLFESARVLEIGPGMGRQFLALSKVATHYAIADISSAVLDHELYEETERHLITSYEDDFGALFNVVCCWYVMHHVKHAERAAFLGFAHRHLVAGGHLYFNIADVSHPNAGSDDGIGTTSHLLAVVEEDLAAVGFEVLDKEFISYECFNLLARKR